MPDKVFAVICTTYEHQASETPYGNHPILDIEQSGTKYSVFQVVKQVASSLIFYRSSRYAEFIATTATYPYRNAAQGRFCYPTQPEHHSNLSKSQISIHHKPDSWDSTLRSPPTMRDLRLKVLRESGKTVSRKARSRPESTQGSARNSPIGSPAVSRAGSRYASEEEISDDNEYDDSLTCSTLSNGSEFVSDETQASTWESLLQDRIAELQDRKRSNVKGRETTIASYLNLIKQHYAGREIGSSAADILSALMRSVRSGGSSAEKLLALKAVQATLLTCPSEALFEDLYTPLQTACEDEEDSDVKAAAVLAMAMAALFAGGSEAAAEEFLDFLISIVDSDGEAVSAVDSGPVVTAALQSWAFVASQMDDIAAQVYDAMEAFVEQLDSTDVEVQTSAGFNIAFIFEAARDEEEETGEPLRLQYDPKRLVSRMAQISKPAVRQMSRKDRRHLRKHFASIVTSLEHGKGPGYSTSGRPASNPHTGGTKVEHDQEMSEFGYREKLRIGDTVVVVDSWSLLARIETVRNVLGGGFSVHFTDNPTVADLLGSPEMEQSTSNSHSGETGARSKKNRR
ncbi:hypothetical protein SODALDRAFT_363351 [Sodiomyces alkalinus F11]|uniref:Interferon-related developmental regulator N-terminal domain-containing protein n=1 Tax=Sodiomyces alkalinus (strain CBS 110278 / VKM F-3762 / F11) TaxID=1314773 RepID=A0A3N2PM80_SODAK|nr:hypothetical protein SODALDRAFT_363351 [Sodiomyces alkalinus F11]ROT35514.1 hypothetical protein SODALDRAFT_363351 [Sodiomyces alkalinus F11]